MRHLLLALLVLAGAARADPPSSGVTGRVMQTPAAPGPQRIGQDESGAPLAGVTVELRKGQGVAASATTAADGSFTIQAAPGVYTLHVQIEGMYPRCPDRPLTVRKGQIASGALRCDSGMR